MIYCTTDFVQIAVSNLARGIYQQTVADGHARISGSDLKTKWGSRYARSRASLVERILEFGFMTCDYYVDGKKFLIVGTTQDEINEITDDELLFAWR